MDKTIYNILCEEKNKKIKNGLYTLTQISFAYNSNSIEGNRFSKEQVGCIYETNSFIVNGNEKIYINDIVEIKNHFIAFNDILDNVDTLDDEYIKNLHKILRAETGDITTGCYKKYPNYIYDIKTTSPKNVEKEINKLLNEYLKIPKISLKDIIDFHIKFERIHPFSDGNGRVGRLLMFKECLRNGIIPFIIDEEHRSFYYKGLKEYDNAKGYLIDTCLSCQDRYKEFIDEY